MKIKYHNPLPSLPRNPLSPPSSGVPKADVSFNEEAVVVDVIVNEEHEDASADGYNVGVIKFKFLESDTYRSSDTAYKAYPLDSNVVEFPLINEIVYVFSSLNRYYYTRKINLGNHSAHQAFPGLSTEMGPLNSQKSRSDTFQKSKITPINVSSTPTEFRLGKYFKEKRVYRLRHWEGDISSTDDFLTLELTKETNITAVFTIVSDVKSVVINEINYNSHNEFNTEDWIELYNWDSEDIDLSGWTIKDGDDAHEFMIPPGSTLESGEYLVIVRDLVTFGSFQTTSSEVIGEMGFGLSNEGECVRLFNSEGSLADQVCYENSNPWPGDANGKGYTLALLSPYYDNNKAQSWYAQNNNGTPGQPNIVPDNITGIDSFSDELISYPNPFTEDTNIRYSLNGKSYTLVQIYDVSGRLIESLWSDFQDQGIHELTWDPDHSLSPGIYYIRVESSGQSASFKVNFTR